MESARSRSPLELPPRSSRLAHSSAVAGSDNDAPLPAAESIVQLPVSLGVLLLGVGVTWVGGLLLTGLILGQTHVQVRDSSRALEQRFGKQLAQLSAANVALQEQQTLCSETIAERAREIELLNARLDALRTRSQADKKAARGRRVERP